MADLEICRVRMTSLQPCGRGALGTIVYVCVSRLQRSPSLRWRAVFKVRLQNPLGCECRRRTAVRVVHNKLDPYPYAVAVIRRSTIVSHVPRKISAVCLLFLADQTQRYYNILSVHVRVPLRDPAHMHDRLQ